MFLSPRLGTILCATISLSLGDNDSTSSLLAQQQRVLYHMWGSPTLLHETILNGNTTTILAEASPLKHTRLHLFLVQMVIVNWAWLRLEHFQSFSSVLQMPIVVACPNENSSLWRSWRVMVQLFLKRFL
jgi:hypothetical protein